jgi:hypothetical protein
LALLHEPLEISAIARRLEWCCERQQRRIVDPAVAPGDLFRAGDLEPLPLLDGRNELARVEQR